MLTVILTLSDRKKPLQNCEKLLFFSVAVINVYVKQNDMVAETADTLKRRELEPYQRNKLVLNLMSR